MCIGDVIDKKYCIIERLGEGGMGTVFLAQHMFLQKLVAIKFLRFQLEGGNEAMKRFFREAKAAASVSHAGVAEIYDLGWFDDENPYIVMEHVDGISLKAFLDRKGGKLSIDLAVELAVQILTVLTAVHTKQIVHRDLKPENIFVFYDQDGKERTKLLDFGVSKMLSVKESTRLTKIGNLLGSVPYMAPEQIQGDLSVDHRADLWALGVVLYEMLTGSVPFRSADIDEMIFLILRAPVSPPSRHRIEIPEALDRILIKTLNKMPANRYEDAAELRSELISFFNRQSREYGVVPCASLRDDVTKTDLQTLQDEPVEDRTVDDDEDDPVVVPCLEVLHGHSTERMVPLTGDEVIVGRDGSCDLVLIDESVSRRHARLYRDGECFVIQDLESCNGVYVNGVKSLVARLRDGDRLLLGYCSHLLYKSLPFAEVCRWESTYLSSSIDQLTGALKRQSLELQLSSSWSVAVQRGELISAALLDVEHLSLINDKYGFAGGDMVLQEIARVVQGSICRKDLVGRYGGNRFLVILHGLDHESVSRFVSRLNQNIRKSSILVNGETITVGVSIGVATAAASTESAPEDLIQAVTENLVSLKQVV